ncbi:MAG TPA: D-glucuronyl C5-epimerase family protein, partial [Solirubrobacteraceae bacterium]|nr:D-glucuronyl C5-epimerase family protein [Solirubrobacteraceae bacterium]
MRIRTYRWRMLALLALATAVTALWALPGGAGASRTVTVTAALQKLQRSGGITEAAYSQYEGAYVAAKSSLRKLSGTRAAELGSVVANVEAMASAGQLIPSRLPVVFTTLERNEQWWTTQPLLGTDQRVYFTGSRIVWEYYPGQGIEIQWLATFGKANAYFLDKETTALKEVLNEAIALATQRAGGIAWEYMFQFDGGSPPWTSGLSQGTALQVLSRAWSKTHEQAYLTAAQQALGIFKTPPPAGVRVATPAGATYLEYTYAPTERILNGFIQSLVGLYEYTKLTGDPVGQQLFEAGDAEARAETPHYDTGAWSMYDQHSESDLSYHELLAEFLEHLCEKTGKGEPLTPTTGPIPGDGIYCTTAAKFREYEKTPPVIALLTQTVGASERAGVQIKLSKVASVSMTIKLGEKTVWSNSATVEGGRPRLLWVTPSKAGTYGVVLRAKDLAGNEEVTTGSIVVKAPSKAKARAARAAGVTASGRISPPAQRQKSL